ncbi:hypothetical protein F190043G2_19830 [Blautia caecimuris]
MTLFLQNDKLIYNSDVHKGKAQKAFTELPEPETAERGQPLFQEIMIPVIRKTFRMCRIFPKCVSKRGIDYDK